MPTKNIIIHKKEFESDKEFTKRMQCIYFSTEQVFPDRIIEWDVNEKNMFARFIVNKNYFGK